MLILLLLFVFFNSDNIAVADVFFNCGSVAVPDGCFFNCDNVAVVNLHLLLVLLLCSSELICLSFFVTEGIVLLSCPPFGSDVSMIRL